MESKCPPKKMIVFPCLIRWGLFISLLFSCSCTQKKCICEDNESFDTISVAELHSIVKNISQLDEEISFLFFVRNESSDTMFMPLNGTIIHPQKYKSCVRVSLNGRIVNGHGDFWMVYINDKPNDNCKKRNILPPGSSAKISVELYSQEIDELGVDYDLPTSSIIPYLKFDYKFDENDRYFSNHNPINLRFTKKDSIFYISKDWDFM